MRNKGGLETPLSGRLWRETRLIFAPPLWYDALTYACLAIGAFAFFNALTGNSLLIFGPAVLIWAGPLVFLAGLWGQLSSERMTCDTKSRTYARREGQGLFKRIIRGPLSELDAIVLISEKELFSATLGGQSITYRLVLHWKNAKEPILVVGSETTLLGPGQPPNARAARIAQTGAMYARILGIQFFDNSYFFSAEPLKPL
jgi:hypothetical protein